MCMVSFSKSSYSSICLSMCCALSEPSYGARELIRDVRVRSGDVHLASVTTLSRVVCMGFHLTMKRRN